MTDITSNATSNRVPDTLYHYCGVEEFHGIISSKQLWLSNASFMNDYMEHKWLIEKASERIDDLSRTHDHPAHYKRLAESFDTDNSPYIFCFSSKGDLLSQWRAYTGDGAGFAVGFSYTSLSSQIDKHHEQRYSIKLHKVDYDEKRQIDFLDKTIKFYADNVSRADLNSLDTEAIAASLHIANSAAICKNPGFVEEDEWRLVLFPSVTGWIPGGEVIKWPIFFDLGPSEICFRVSGNRIIPFFKLAFSADAITEIYLGPKNYARESDYSLRMFLQNQGFDPEGVTIIRSEATYR
jgi:hypothetical protein